MGRSKGYSYDAFDRRASRAVKHAHKSAVEKLRLSSYTYDADDENLDYEDDLNQNAASPHTKENK